MSLRQVAMAPSYRSAKLGQRAAPDARVEQNLHPSDVPVGRRRGWTVSCATSRCA
jgi:hypothetical protein